MGKDFKIDQISDREFRAEGHHFLLGEDHILYATLNGDSDDELGLEIDRRIICMAEQIDGEIDMLIDLNRAGKASSKSRKLFKAFTESSKCRRIALFGGHFVSTVIASFVMGISKNKNMKFFKTREEALQWLSQQ